MKRLLIFLIPILLFNVSCWKTGFARADGHVIDSHKNPVAYADVTISRGYGYNGDYDEVEHGKTDAQGYFKIKYFKGRAVYHYYIRAEAKDPANGSITLRSEKLAIDGIKQTFTLSL